MTELILNGAVTPERVPTVRYQKLGPDPEGYVVAWCTLRRFAATFDPEQYARSTGVTFNSNIGLEQSLAALAGGPPNATLLPLGDAPKFSQLRAMLWLLCHEGQGPVSGQLADAILDGIYLDVSGGSARPVGDPGPYEPALGLCGANFGSDQHRFWFVSKETTDRDLLFDRVAGLLLRHANPEVVVSALYLRPPNYPIETGAPPTHTFMLLLEWRTRGSEDLEGLVPEYKRLCQLCVEAFGDLRHDHWPRVRSEGA